MGRHSKPVRRGFLAFQIGMLAVATIIVVVLMLRYGGGTS